LRGFERKQPPEVARPELTALHEIEIDRADNFCFVVGTRTNNESEIVAA
jgi:hypothetical protein